MYTLTPKLSEGFPLTAAAFRAAETLSLLRCVPGKGQVPHIPAPPSTATKIVFNFYHEKTIFQGAPWHLGSFCVICGGKTESRRSLWLVTLSDLYSAVRASVFPSLLP